MSHSLPLSAYLALRRGDRAGTPAAPACARPNGALLWCHATTPDRVATAASLRARLAAAGGPPSVVVTCKSLIPRPDLISERAPADQREAVRAFLDYWRPDLLLWLGGALRPTLLAECENRLMPRILADLHGDEIGIDGGSWLPGVTRPLLAGFDAVFAAEPEALNRLRRAGVAQAELAGPLDTVGPALPCSERDRADVAAAIGTRPVWLAAGLPPEEVEAVAAAHRHAGRRSHRLLLVAVPPEGASAELLTAAFRAHGLSTASRAEGEDPTEEHQVVVADGTGEMGLWYRMAPVTYLAGSLRGTGCRSPFEAASLGAALVIGPLAAPHEALCERIARRGGLVRVHRDEELGTVLEQLIAPDRAAALAAAAWDEATRGAAATDLIVDAIRGRIAVPA